MASGWNVLSGSILNVSALSSRIRKLSTSYTVDNQRMKKLRYFGVITQQVVTYGALFPSDCWKMKLWVRLTHSHSILDVDQRAVNIGLHALVSVRFGSVPLVPLNLDCQAALCGGDGDQHHGQLDRCDERPAVSH